MNDAATDRPGGTASVTNAPHGRHSAGPGATVSGRRAAAGPGNGSTASRPDRAETGATAPDDAAMLAIARAEAELGLAEGGIPIGAALFAADGTLLGRGHNRRVQDDDASMHAETNAFRNAGRQPGYAGTTMVTTLSPCWYCSGLVKQFGISRVLVGEDVTFSGGHDWLRDQGVEVEIVRDPALIAMMGRFIAEYPRLWNEDIGALD